MTEIGNLIQHLNESDPFPGPDKDKVATRKKSVPILNGEQRTVYGGVLDNLFGDINSLYEEWDEGVAPTPIDLKELGDTISRAASRLRTIGVRV
jgi:hypothetical protein